MKNSNSREIINLSAVFKVLWQKRKYYLYILPIVFVLSCVWIFPQPRYYDCTVALAPEAGGETVTGGLSSIASSFGINIGDLGNNDAIYPLLYPDLFESPEFIVGLFDIQIQTKEGDVKTDYYTYLKDHQKKNVLTYPFVSLMNSIKKHFESDDDQKQEDGSSKVNSFYMSKDEFDLANKIMDNITCSADKRTNVVTIIVRDQDPLVCATIADSVKAHLQDFIIRYRTSKARQDCAYYQHLTDSAKLEYEEALAVYTAYSDSHKDVILQAYISERDKLENDMSMKFNTYNAMNTQLQAMRAKVQEHTPAFTTLKSATVPIKPSGPKRMIFVFGMLLLATFITSLYLARKEIHIMS